MNIVTSLRAEMLKTKRTASFYLTLAAAAFSPLMSLLDILLDEGISANDRSAIFQIMMTKKFMMPATVIFPLFVILICTLLPQIEYKNNAWKQVLTAPKTKGNIFAAKFINVQLLMLLFLLTDMLLMFICVIILHVKDPSLNILRQSINVHDIILTRLNAYLALLAICTIQFWLGLRFRNFIAPIAIGIALWFGGTILVFKEVAFAAYFPYSLHAWGKFPKFDPLVNMVGWTSVVYAVLFLAIGFADFKRSGSTH